MYLHAKFGAFIPKCTIQQLIRWTIAIKCKTNTYHVKKHSKVGESYVAGLIDTACVTDKGIPRILVWARRCHTGFQSIDNKYCMYITLNLPT